MALVDLQSDLSKFRSSVKPTGETRPETSKAKSSTAFGSFQPISEKLSSLSPKITKPRQEPIQNKLSSTTLDDVVKKMSADLIINSVSRYSPINVEDRRKSDIQPSIEEISSKFQEIRQDRFTSRLNKSDILVLKAENGTNNLTSPIEVNLLLAKTFDRRSSSPDVFGINQIDSKEISSPSIFVNKQDASDNITNPDVGINRPVQTFDRTEQSPNVLRSSNIVDKSPQSPEVFGDPLSTDKSGQSPDVFGDPLSLDKSGQSPDVFGDPLSLDKSGQSPDVFGDPLSLDKSGQSPDPLKAIQTDNKINSSPPIKTDGGEFVNNITDPKTDVFGRPLSFDRRGQSAIINKDIVSPINNIVNPDIVLDINQLTFDKESQSPEIFTETLKQGLVTNPNTKVFRIEQGTNHLQDESRLNPDGIPFRFITDSRLANRQPSRPVDDKLRYDGVSNQIEDNSLLNVDGVIKTNPAGRNEDSDRSFYSVKGTQEVNFFGNTNASGFTSKPQKGVSEYSNNSEYAWLGTRTNAPETNFLLDTNGTGFTKFVINGDTKFKNETSKYGFTGKPAVNYFDLNDQHTTDGFSVSTRPLISFYKKDSSVFDWDGNRGNAFTTGRFTKFITPLITQYVKDSSVFSWKGSNQNAPEVNFLDSDGQKTSKGFHRFSQLYDSAYQIDSSNYVWKGSNQQAPSTNFFTDSNGQGFTTFSPKLESKYTNESSELTFKGSLPNPIDYFTDTNSSGFLLKTVPLQSAFTQDSSRFTFKGSSRSAPSVNFINDDVNSGFTTFVQSQVSEFKRDISRFSFEGTSRQAKSVNYLLDTNNTGFTTFAQSQTTEFKTDVSRYGFVGSRQAAPETNFFSDTPSSGFNRLAVYLDSKYIPKSSKYTWNGDRQKAPEVNFFYIPGTNPNAIAGFNKLFVDKTDTKLSDSFSRLSFAGTTVRSTKKPVPYTNFFGFTPSERTGFMVDMSTFDGTLYPNIFPSLNYNDSPGARLGVERLRALRGGMKTTKEKDEKYAPKSLGPRPWIDGTLISTLDAQIPDGQIKTGAKAGSYLRKYERSLKEGTDNLGFVTKWATTRRSPSPLDDQYNKFKLQKEAVNREPAFFFQPYIVRGIQRDGEVENQRWGFGVTLDDGLIRGGVVTQVERTLADTIRLAKWSASIKGLLFNVRQIGLQLMNPNVDINPLKPESSFLGLSATQIFNPIGLLGNIPSARFGLHLPRHGVLPFNKNYLNRYEDATLARESKSKFIDPQYKKFDDLASPTLLDRQKDYNRLIGLMKELLPNSFKPVVAAEASSDFTTAALAKAGLELAKQLTGQTGIVRVSSTFGGPQSVLGIGGTQINRAKHPYLTHYTTTPLLMLTGEQKEPQYQLSAKRNTYYAAMATYNDSFNLSNILRELAYNLPSGPYEINDENTTRNIKNVKNVQPLTVDRIVKQNPFDPKYDLFDNRLRALDANKIQRAESLAKGLNPIHTNGSNPLVLYRTATYDKLGVSRDRRRSRNSTTNVGDINDFRADLDLDNPQLEAFITNPEIADFANNNLEDRYGFGSHGKVGSKRNNPSVNSVSYGKAREGHSVPILKDPDVPFRGDRINIIDYKQAKFDLSKDLVYETGKYNDPNLPGADDLIEFYFTGVMLSGTRTRPAEAIVFRATFGNISDTHSPEWNAVKYMGRADPLYIYQGYERDISFDFVVQITSRDEMKATWRKLNHLASWTAPEYTKGGFMRGPIVRLNLGNLYRKMPGFMSSIRYNFDNSETTWETAKLRDDQYLDGPNAETTSPGVLQLPKTIKVECSFTPIGVYRPEYNGILYSLYDDSAGGNLENGLVPNNDVRVNYFKSFDVDSSGGRETYDSSENKRYYKIPIGEETVIPTIDTNERENISNTEQSNEG